MDELGTIGFVGTGSIARAMVEGLSGGAGEGPPIVLSPRSAGISADLERRFPRVRVAADNAAVVEGADVVVLAVRPEQLAEALAGTTFRDGQVVVSVLAGVNVAEVEKAVGADVPVVRAIPLPPVSRREGVTPITPGHPVAATLFDALGGALAVADEAELSVFSGITGAVTGYLQYVSTLCNWAADRGVPRATAEEFVRSMIASTAPDLRTTSEPMDEVIRAHETPGGLNEQLRLAFFDATTTASLRSALDGLLDRVTR